MHIGELARKAFVNIQSIRFYERAGLLPAPARTSSGYRSYDDKALDDVNFIKLNQQLGFTLAEIKQLIDLHRVVAALPFPRRQKPSELRGIIAIGRERLGAMNQKARTLRNMQRRLTALLKQLESATVIGCPAASAVKTGARKTVLRSVAVSTTPLLFHPNKRPASRPQKGS